MSKAFEKIFGTSGELEALSKSRPDIRRLIEAYAEREPWTYSREEFETLYEKTSAYLDRIDELMMRDDFMELAIPLLASLPMQSFLIGMAYLESKKRDRESPWSALLYDAAIDLAAEGDGDISAFAHVIIERIEIISKSRVISQLFTNKA